jgi:hypothetical protein
MECTWCVSGVERRNDMDGDCGIVGRGDSRSRSRKGQDMVGEEGGRHGIPKRVFGHARSWVLSDGVGNT